MNGLAVEGVGGGALGDEVGNPVPVDQFGFGSEGGEAVVVSGGGGVFGEVGGGVVEPGLSDDFEAEGVGGGKVKGVAAGVFGIGKEDGKEVESSGVFGCVWLGGFSVGLVGLGGLVSAVGARFVAVGGELDDLVEVPGEGVGWEALGFV